MMKLKYKKAYKPKNPSLYYDIRKDIEAYPDAIIYIIFGGRSTGKTYSALRYAIEQEKRYLFMKRTDDDVENLVLDANAEKDKDKREKTDLNPFKSINRDFEKCNYTPLKMKKGLAAFYNQIDDDTKVLSGYCMSLNKVSKYKGADFSDVEYIIFDEFVPTKYQVVRKAEGMALLDLYMTVSRDREQRGREAVKLFCLANADDVSSPTTEALQITDTIAKMAMSGQSVIYDPDRYILIHRLTDNKELMRAQAQNKIYKTMAGTSWLDMSLSNQFAYNDFSDISSKCRMKGMKARAAFMYERKLYYVYSTDEGYYYIGEQKTDQPVRIYDLKKESEQNAFYYDFVFEIRDMWLNGGVAFCKYTIKDLFLNYHKIFTIY